jgi:serine/threonine-protein kinase RIO1
MGEEEEREVDPVAARISEIIARVQRLRQPFRTRRQAIIDGILRGMEARSRERYRAYRYHNPSEEEEEKLKKEIENLKQQLEEMQRRPKPIVAIKGE